MSIQEDHSYYQKLTVHFIFVILIYQISNIEIISEENILFVTKNSAFAVKLPNKNNSSYISSTKTAYLCQCNCIITYRPFCRYDTIANLSIGDIALGQTNTKLIYLLKGQTLHTNIFVNIATYLITHTISER